MRVWLVMSISYLIIPMAMLITGILYIKRPAKTMNWMYGYRTQRAMKDQEAWNFAQNYFGKVCTRLGMCLTIFVAILMLYVFGQSVETLEAVGMILAIVEVITLVYALTPTERALKKRECIKEEKKKPKRTKIINGRVLWQWMEKKEKSDCCGIMEQI